MLKFLIQQYKFWKHFKMSSGDGMITSQQFVYNEAFNSTITLRKLYCPGVTWCVEYTNKVSAKRKILCVATFKVCKEFYKMLWMSCNYPKQWFNDIIFNDVVHDDWRHYHNEL